MSKKKKIGIGIGVGLVAIVGVLSALIVAGKKLHEELDFHEYEN